jgi:hypothetical protein
MKKIATTLALLAVCSLAASTAFASNSVRISQLYGGGGNAGATYQNDYVELFNFSGSPVDISGWSLQYQSAAGTGDQGTCVNCLTTFPPGSVIPSCGYFLIQLAAGATPSGALPVTPDLIIPQATANNLSATAGKIGLKASATTGPCLPYSGWVDFVGYGTAATCAEGSAAGGLSNTTGAVRKLGGLTDSDNNNLDFDVVSTPIPRNTQSPKNTECQAVPTTPQTWGAIKGIYR